jgi:hypothetical protein
MFYAYLHIDPRDGVCRYVGVGSKSRGFDWGGRSPSHVAWIAELDALDLEPVIAFPFKTRDRDEVFEAERDLIRFHRAYGSPLFNVTDGGLGAAGLKRSEEQKEKSRAAHVAKWLFDPEFRARRLPDMAKARAARNRSAEHLAKITKHDKIQGSPCKKCGGTLRYKTGRNCVNCARKP